MSAGDVPRYERYEIVEGNVSPQEIFAHANARLPLLKPELRSAYERLGNSFAASMRDAFPTVAPELLGAVTANAVAKLAGLTVGNPDAGIDGLQFEHAYNVACIAALRLWESGS